MILNADYKGVKFVLQNAKPSKSRSMPSLSLSRLGSSKQTKPEQNPTIQEVSKHLSPSKSVGDFASNLTRQAKL